MALAPGQAVAVFIDGIDISDKVKSVCLKPAERELIIELDRRYGSDKSTARRHLKGLQKAKD